jgi:dTDP-4-amino-4,6-dideoxygalactose transaminase
VTRGPGIPTAPPFIPISAPRFGEEEERLVLHVLRSGAIAQGPMVERLEGLFAAMAGTPHAVAVSSGTVALDAALEVLSIGPGDEVITSPFTFVATLNAILRRGATARFADITGDYVIDPASVAALVSGNTRALLPVHLYGLMADMERIGEVADGRGLAIVEDAAQAHGATLHGRAAGSFGIGCFSLYATKNVTSGEGGVVTTTDPDLAQRIRLLRNQGMRGRYDYAAVGHNWRMTDLAAALAIPQMERLPTIAAQRRHNAERLTELIGADRDVVTPATPPGREHAWHQYTVLLPAGCDRDRVVAALHDRGVGSGVYYPRLVWDYPLFQGNPLVIRDDTPRAAGVARRCLSLPIHPGVGDSDLARIAEALRSAVAG